MSVEALIEAAIQRWPDEIAINVVRTADGRYFVSGLNDLADRIAEADSMRFERIASLNVHQAILTIVHEAAKSFTVVRTRDLDRVRLRDTFIDYLRYAASDRSLGWNSEDIAYALALIEYRDEDA